MKAVGYRQSKPIAEEGSLLDLDLPEPTPGPRDLLVRVEAVSVNPVDTKLRMRKQPAEGEPPARSIGRAATANCIWSTSGSSGASRRRRLDQPLDEALAAAGLGPVEYVASLTATAQHLPAIVNLLAPQGGLAVIDDPKTVDIMPFKRRSVRTAGSTCSCARRSRRRT